MSCEHEFESLRTADGSFCMTACRKCMKSTGEIETLFKAEQQIADLIQQQAATIEALKLCWNCKFIEADRCNKHNCLVDYPMRDKCDNWQVKEGQ